MIDPIHNPHAAERGCPTIPSEKHLSECSDCANDLGYIGPRKENRIMSTYSVERYCGDCRYPGCDGAGKIDFRLEKGFRELAPTWEDCPGHDRCDYGGCGEPMDARDCEARPISVRVMQHGCPTFTFDFCDKDCADAWLMERENEPDIEDIMVAFASYYQAMWNGPAFKSDVERSEWLNQLDELIDGPGELDQFGQTLRDIRDFLEGSK